MSSFKVKLYLPGKENIRRFTLESNQTFAHFVQSVQSFYNGTAAEGVVFQYEDEEGDWITFSTEFEFQECLRNHDKLKILRIKLVAPSAKPASKKGKEPKKTAEKAVWEWHDKGTWVAYDEKTSKQLEKAHSKGIKQEFGINLGGKPYSINLSTMVQQNLTTKYCRPIRRRIDDGSKPADEQKPLPFAVGANDIVVDVTDAIRGFLPNAAAGKILGGAPCQDMAFTDVPFIHKGVTCDGCQMYPIIGVRYKCQGCADYDLCQSCHDKKDTIHKHDHSFLAIHHGNPANKYDKIVTHIIYEDDPVPAVPVPAPAPKAEEKRTPVPAPKANNDDWPKEDPLAKPQPQPVPPVISPRPIAPAPFTFPVPHFQQPPMGFPAPFAAPAAFMFAPPAPAPVKLTPAPAPVAIPAVAPVVAPTPAPAPAVVPEVKQEKKPEEVNPFKVHLTILAEMGFTDAALNMKLLEQHKGNLQKVVDHYLKK